MYDWGRPRVKYGLWAYHLLPLEKCHKQSQAYFVHLFISVESILHLDSITIYFKSESRFVCLSVWACLFSFSDSRMSLFCVDRDQHAAVGPVTRRGMATALGSPSGRRMLLQTGLPKASLRLPHS